MRRTLALAVLLGLASATQLGCGGTPASDTGTGCVAGWIKCGLACCNSATHICDPVTSSCRSTCKAQSAAEFCAAAKKNCGSYTGTDSCQQARTEDCGTCAPRTGTCVGNVCSCDTSQITCGTICCDRATQVCNASKDNCAGQLPLAPVIYSPPPGGLIKTPLKVSGGGEANASIALELYNGATLLVSGAGKVTAARTFAVSLTYAAPAQATPLKLKAVLTNSAGASPATTVDVNQEIWPPLVSAPASNAAVVSPITVTGKADPGATAVKAEVINGKTVIGSGTGTISAGAFSFAVTYTNAASGTPLVVSVTQTVAGVASVPEQVGVKQQ